MNVLKSILHNIGVTVVSFVVALIGLALDRFLNIHGFQSIASLVLGLILLAVGFYIRAWATYLFYASDIKVIVLKPQGRLITTGPFRFSRNPLYLGGNVFMFLGACLVLGTISGVAITLIGIGFTNLMIRREECQLLMQFGTEWTEYKKRVRRWI